MAKFFVGQRVRLVRGLDLTSPAENAGIEGRIFVFDTTPKGTIASDLTPIKIDCDCGVIWDGEKGVFAQHTAQLEPILPEGHRAGEEGRCELLDELLERQREAA